MVLKVPDLMEIDRFFRRHALTKHNRLAAWMRFAHWQIRSRIQEEATVEWIGGQKFIAKRGMTGITGNIYAGLHEFPDMGFLLHFLREDDLFLDIGANVGSYTLLAAGVCKARCVAFEPDPISFSRIERNVALNGLADRVSLYQIALGADPTTVKFTCGGDTTNRVVPDSFVGVTQSVRQDRLDSVVNGMAPLMIKIDVEGHEDEVIAGAVHTLASRSLKVLQIETVSEWLNRRLLEEGFIRVSYDPFTRNLQIGGEVSEASNLCFVRNPEFVNRRVKNGNPFRVLGVSI